MRGEFAGGLPIVLHEEEVAPLADARLRLRGKLVGTAGTGVEVRQVIPGSVYPGRHVDGGAGEAAAKRVDAVERIGIVHQDVESQPFIAGLPLVLAGGLGVSAAQIDGGGELRLRIGGLAAVTREADNILRRDAAADAVAFRQSGDAEQFAHRRRAHSGGRAVHAQARDGEAEVHYFTAGLDPSHAHGASLIERIEVAEGQKCVLHFLILTLSQ